MPSKRGPWICIPLISARPGYLPNAVEKIAFEHFHVAKILCFIVDKTRQGKMKSVPLTAKKSVPLLLSLAVWT
jgi:hypothetical protein